MNDSQLFDGTAFCWLEQRTGQVVLLDKLPPCACGTPSDEALLNVILAFIDGDFPGVRELKCKEPSTPTSLLLTYLQGGYRPLWLSIDLESIEGMGVMALLHEIKSGTARSDRDLAAHAIHVVEMAYANAGRANEFNAAAQRVLEMRRKEETTQ